MRGYLQKALDLAKEQDTRVPTQAFSVATLYARLGEKNQALEWLQKAYQEQNDLLVTLKADPRFDGLRSDPRYTELVQRIGLAR